MRESRKINHLTASETFYEAIKVVILKNITQREVIR